MVEIVCWMQPRPFKSVSSAIRMKKYAEGSTMIPPADIVFGQPYTLSVTPEAREQADILVTKYHDFILFEGDRKDLVLYMSQFYIGAKQEFAEQQSISEDWVTEIFGYKMEDVPESETKEMPGESPFQEVVIAPRMQMQAQSESSVEDSSEPPSPVTGVAQTDSADVQPEPELEKAEDKQ